MKSIVCLPTALVLAFAFVPTSGRAGCLAPKDSAVDAGIGSGPLWGDDAGDLLYVRTTGVRTSLAVRSSAGLVDDVASVGDATGFVVGGSSSKWDAFSNGTINADADVAFVASIQAPDDPNTTLDESGAHRGTYARRGGTIYEIARFGADSPIPEIGGGRVPWGSSFDAVAADRDAQGFLTVVFSAQVAGTVDHRIGLFRWNERTPSTVTPALMVGDAAPSGGTFTSIARLRGDGPGDAAFFAVTRVSETSPQIPGIFVLRADGSVVRIVKFGTAGDSAPGGGTFSVAGDFDVDDAGAMVFAATVQGGPRKTALFRAAPPTYTPELLASEGDATPIAGTFASFASAIVRVNAGGEALVSVPFSEDVGGEGLFSFASGSTTPTPLILVEDVLSIAAIGAGRASYLTPKQIRVVRPSDGTEEGPTDFRIVNLDVKNQPAGPRDTIVFEGRICLPAWDVKAPAAFRSDAKRLTPTQSLTGGDLNKIAQAKVIVSQSDGNNFTFNLAGTDTAPTGSYLFNNQAQTLKKISVKPDGSAATWTFSGNPGPGSLLVDLAAGKFLLKVSSALIHPSYEPSSFRVAFILRSAADVAGNVPDDQSYFWRDLRIAASQPSFGGGRRVTSKGEGTPGGNVYVDTLKATRNAAKGTDAVQVAGVLRLCPGTVAAPTPILPATIRVGSFHLDNAQMKRVGRTGTSYRYTAPNVDFRIDLVKSTFSLKTTAPKLAELVDPVAGSATNDSKSAVGGMKLTFSLLVPHVYDATFDVAMTRAKGGKTFSR